MSVGVLAHLFGSLPYRELAPKVAESGFSHVQLALWKSISDVDFSKPGNISPGLANAIGEQFDKNGVAISVLGCYVHLFDRNEEVRRANVNRFKELLRYAKFFGAPMVAAETGRNEDGNYTDRDWSIMKSTLEELVEEAEKWGVFVGLEAAHGHLIGTAPELARMLEEVPSSNIGVVIDPGNLLTAANFAKQDQVIEEAFELLGNRIIAAHAKDRILLDSGELATVTAGLGQMNYELYMKLLNQYKPHVHIIMEEAKEHQMAQSKAYMDGIRGRV
ncbi:sugar phosphate isomerase/epimerase family protein [Paenibacillus sp. PL91]|uniref:sugar phosphate isomerase/epimerase family protein n=1 Tax=Paenibacillus sp. PL91 TaxID=2729538 RepID=UPI00145D18C7|nr:sugar phosphate isomerase/epimerase [Paenibacillus sp. PL91]MBC9201716.1 sugar phosphate isomerase/epimerase [Paenibacillus sp. PL91]